MIIGSNLKIKGTQPIDAPGDNYRVMSNSPDLPYVLILVSFNTDFQQISNNS